MLEHTLDGKSPGDRMEAAGYASAGWGENIAAGQRTRAEAIVSWMNSEGHRAHILNPQYTEVGIGIVASEGGTPYYTLVFARPRGKLLVKDLGGVRFQPVQPAPTVAPLSTL